MTRLAQRAFVGEEGPLAAGRASQSRDDDEQSADRCTVCARWLGDHDKLLWLAQRKIRQSAKPQSKPKQFHNDRAITCVKGAAKLSTGLGNDSQVPENPADESVLSK